MENRLPFLKQFSLLVFFTLFLFFRQLNAQCTCPCPVGTGVCDLTAFFLFSYCGPDTIFLDASCTATLSFGGSPPGVCQTSGATAFGSPLGIDTLLSGGFAEGDLITGPQTVTMAYVATDTLTPFNQDTFFFDIVFVDTFPPVFTDPIPPDLTIDCVSDFPASLSLMADDSCDITFPKPIPSADTPLPPSPCPVGTVTRTWTATDASGNSTTESQLITFVKDTIPPVISVLPTSETVECDVADYATWLSDQMTRVTNNSTDNCGIETINNDGPMTFNVLCGAVTVQFTVTDSCGNLASALATYTILDTIAPVLTGPADITINCEDPIPAVGVVVANDNCDMNLPPAVFVQNSTQTNTGACTDYTFTINRNWTVTDTCGNVGSFTQTISVEDITNPTFVLPPDITVECQFSQNTAITGSPKLALDNCDPAPVVSFTDNITPLSCPNNLSIQRTWRIEDVCGNFTEGIQIITTEDNTPPIISVAAQDLTINCVLEISIDSTFNDWVNTNGNAIASDNCSLAGDLIWFAYNNGTSSPADLPLPICPSLDTTGVFRMQTVDFVVADECGNRDTTTATFKVLDNTPPALTDCPPDITLDTDPGACFATTTLLIPVVLEECNNLVFPDNPFLTLPITTAPGVDTLETPVDPLIFDFSVPSPPASALGMVSLQIDLNGADAESPTEFFDILGEDGTVLGQTNLTSVQCGSSTTTVTFSAAQFNQWAFDGLLTITLEPDLPSNLPGRFAINALCGGSVDAQLIYDVKIPDGLVFEYSVNGSPRIEMAPIMPFLESFDHGTNLVTYYFTDCTGNESSCSFTITVEDNEAPEIICPPDVTISLAPGTCQAEVEIPLFLAVTDNCGVTTPITQTQPTNPADSYIHFSFNPNLGDFLAGDKVFLFDNLTANATPGTVDLIINIQGDVNDPGEFFEIFDPFDNFLGTTEIGQSHVTPGDCNTVSTAIFSVPSDTFNVWAANGSFAITARSFMSFPIPPGGPGSGINPCDPSLVTMDGDIDTLSMMTATIRYESVTPTAHSDGATVVPPTILTPPLMPPVETLEQGVTTVTYEIEDLQGNLGTCSFDITVEDNEPPNVLCGPSFVGINPSGLVQDTIFPVDIDLGTTDNCTIKSLTVSPNLVTCDLIGTSIAVTLTATDQAGNTAGCTTFVAVEAQAPAPFAISNCGSDTLQLFANAPLAPGGNDVYQYEWTGPLGFVSFEKNPVILNANESFSGFYTVSITGITGCGAIGTVQLTVNDLPLAKPVLMVDNPDLCSGDAVNLSTAPVSGGGVNYQWYSGIAPGGTLLATTNIPEFSIPPPLSPGTFDFYVVVERSGCASEASIERSINIGEIPVAVPQEDLIIICGGETLSLGAFNANPQETCHWIGPCGFESFSCNPLPIVSISSCNEGVYQLIVTKNGCDSDPEFVVVNVIDQPAKPDITNNTSAANPACEGDAITLTATAVPGAISYEWRLPDFSLITTPTNLLTLVNVTTEEMAGEWAVTVIGNPCRSLMSNPTMVFISGGPVAVSATANPGLACEGQNVQLSASSGSQNVNFLWTFPDGQTSALQNPLIENAVQTDGGIYNLLVTNEFGCITTDTVSVNIVDRVNITGIANDAPNCVSGPVNIQLSATVFPPNDGSYTYEWSGLNFSSTDTMATIPNATILDSGPYTLVVTNGVGCASLPVTTTVTIPPVVPDPLPPALDLNNPFCEGETVTLTTSTNTPIPGTDISFLWSTPTGTFSTTTPTLSVGPLSMPDSGSYTVLILADGCQSKESGASLVQVNPTPVIQVGNNSPICEGSTLSLFTDCSEGALYEWMGPGAFNSSICNPIIPNVNKDLHEGAYGVRVNIDGCWSDVVFTNVNISPKPITPIAVNFGPYCTDKDDVIVSVSPGSSTDGALYTWFEVSGVPLSTTSPSLSFTIPNPIVFGEGEFEFFVVASLNGCDSDPSAPTLITFNTIPNNEPNAGPDKNICEGDVVNLEATPPSTGTGRWELISGNPTGVSISNPDAANTTVSGLNSAEVFVFRWYLSNGACEDYASDDANVFVDFIEQADAGEMNDLCNVSSFHLNAILPLSNIGMWSQPNAQSLLGVNIVDPLDPKTEVNGVVPGNSYFFTWTIEGGCGQSSDDVLIQISNETAFAGTDFDDCGDGCTQLSATAPNIGSGVWTSPDPKIDFISPNDPNTIACNLKEGQNIFIWTILNGACGGNSIDSVFVSYEPSTVVRDDAVDVDFGSSAVINVTDNDIIPGNFSLDIIQQPLGGTLETLSNGQLTYTARVDFLGSDLAIYEVCAQNCDCARANVIFRVGADATCQAPNIITPNHDGINDAFIIPCMAGSNQFPNSELRIFNQWGDEVFTARPYLNNWEGTWDGEDLPPGTYFYIVDLGNNDKPMSGFLVIQR